MGNIINNITEETFIKSKHIVIFRESIYGSKGWLEKIHWKNEIEEIRWKLMKKYDYS